MIPLWHSDTKPFKLHLKTTRKIHEANAGGLQSVPRNLSQQLIIDICRQPLEHLFQGPGHLFRQPNLLLIEPDHYNPNNNTYKSIFNVPTTVDNDPQWDGLLYGWNWQWESSIDLWLFGYASQWGHFHCCSFGVVILAPLLLVSHI